MRQATRLRWALHIVGAADLGLYSQRYFRNCAQGNVYEDINTSYEEFIQTFDYGARLEEDVKDLATQISSLSQKIEDPEVNALQS